MNSMQYKRAVGLYYSRDNAEAVIRALRDSNFDMDKVSVIARDADTVADHQTTETEEIGNKADEGATAGALTGGALGGITGLLVGLGALAIPGVGPILLAGAEATAIATTLAGAGIGAVAGGLVGALIGLGIPEEKARTYSDGVAQGGFLVMVVGTAAQIASAESIMRRHDVKDFDVYDAPAPETPKTAATTARTELERPATQDAENLKLYEERLVVDKERHKAGEVNIGKRVETQEAEVVVPVNEERIVIERTENTNGTVVNPNQVDFSDREVARMDVYKETADIEKQAFVREEVNVRKEVEHDSVSAQETIRREELDVEADGDVVNQNNNYRK
ncbi:MAG TPA: YsnF/AvaK domain-containing protein [Xenococcaceae cyanobacterium]